VDLERAMALAATFGALATSDDDVARDPDRLDAVVVASSTDTHSAHPAPGGRSGLAVYRERPIDLDP